MLTLPFAVLVLTLAAPDKGHMLPREMEVGKVSTLWPAGVPLAGEAVKYVITEIGDDWIAVRVETHETEGDRMAVLVRGIPTKGLVDGRSWKPAGEYKVEKTEKYKGKTVFSLKPHPKEK